jgi:hypothetical protein
MKKRLPIHLCLPFASAALLCYSSFSPWLHDPLGKFFSPWEIAIDSGWRIPVLNYGMLYLLIAFLILLSILPATRRIGSFLGLSSPGVTSLLCLFPLMLFLFQVLFYDFSLLDRLAQHNQQALLIQNLFFYSVSDQLLPLRPFSIDLSSLWGRGQLLLDQVTYGLLLPLPAFLLLLFWECRFADHPSSKYRYRHLFPLSLVVLLGFTLIRACLGTFYEYQARISLASGFYVQALGQLDSAHLFLPTLDETTFYHLERGQALYYLSPRVSTPESLAYLAANYRSRQAFSDAFEQGYTLWSSSPNSPWITSELSETLEVWIASRQPLQAELQQPLDQASAVLPPLQTLEQIDSSNVYGWYLDGRIYYAFHAYSRSQESLERVLSQCQEPELLSSIYTYLALSESGLGKLVDGRLLLFKALSYDPDYRNNTAREALSGLH